MGSILTILSGYKTYVAAVGLVGLAVYNLSVGDFASAGNNFLLALVAVGLRGAVKSQTQEVKEITENQTRHFEYITNKQTQELKSST